MGDLTVPPAGSDWPLSRGRAWSVALAGTLTMAVSYVDRQALAALAPTVTRELAISDPAYGWLQAAFSLAYLVAAPLAGRWVDRAGARLALFALRILLGLAEAPSFPGAAQTVQRVLPPPDRAAGFGVLFTGSSVGAAVAPPLAVALAGRFGWRLSFVGTSLAGLLWLPLWWWATRSREVRALLDRRGAPNVSRAAPSPFRLARHPAVLRAMAVVVATSPALAFLLLWGAKLLVALFGMSQAETARYLWFPPLCFDAGSVLFGALATRVDRRHWAAPQRLDTPHRGLFALALLLTAGLALVPFARTPWEAMGCGGLAMAGGGGLLALLTSDMLARVPQEAISTASGVTAAAQSAAYIVANPLIGFAVKRTGSYRPAIFGLAAWLLPGCLTWLLWRPPPRVVRAEGPPREEHAEES